MPSSNDILRRLAYEEYHRLFQAAGEPKFANTSEKMDLYHRARVNVLEGLLEREEAALILQWFRGDQGQACAKSGPLGRGIDELMLAAEEMFRRKGNLQAVRQMWREASRMRGTHAAHPSLPPVPPDDIQHGRFAFDNYERVLVEFNDDPEELEAIREAIEKLSRGVRNPLKRKKKKPKAATRRVDEDYFWELVATTRSARDPESLSDEALISELETLPGAEIVKFHRLLQKKLRILNTWDLWGVADLLRGGCSDDGFSDFRAWVIAQGKEVFERAQKVPEDFGIEVATRGTSLEFEQLLYAANAAYETVSEGESLDEKDSSGAESPAGEEWSEEQLPTRFPRLSKL